MPGPPRERISEEEILRGECGKLRTAMAGMGVGGEEMDEGEATEFEKDNVEEFRVVVGNLADWMDNPPPTPPLPPHL